MKMAGTTSDTESARPYTRKTSPLPDIFQYLLVMAGLCWLFSASVEQLGYNWQWYQVTKYIYTFNDGAISFGPLLEGLAITVKISALSLFFSIVIGLVTTCLRLSSAPVARSLARIYLEITRNSPLLIQIFFIYFVLGPVLGFDRFFSAVLSLSLFEGAYVSEILRSGILSIDKGQIEAGKSLGLNSYLNYRHILLPQAIQITLPPLTNQAISLIKDSALVSTIAIYDLTMQAQFIIAETFLTFEIWFTIALMYLFITLALSGVAAILERRVGKTTHN